MQLPSSQASCSFSFAVEAPRTLSHGLRLRTNQSLEEQSSKQLHRFAEEHLRSDQEERDSGHCLRLAHEEHSLRLDSLGRQYQLRLSKQEQYYALREWKLKAEVDNLQKQNALLSEELRKGRAGQKQQPSHCSQCSDGELIAHYAKLLKESEEHHAGCLSEKRELTRKVEEANAKVSALEQQHEEACREVRNLARQQRHSESKAKQAEGARDQALLGLAQKQFVMQRNCFGQNEEKRQGLELNQSKATVQSTQSMLTNPRPSLKSSMLSRRPNEDKENELPRGRPSHGKFTAVFDEPFDVVAPQTRSSVIVDSFPRQGVQQRHQSVLGLRWKCF